MRKFAFSFLYKLGSVAVFAAICVAYLAVCGVILIAGQLFHSDRGIMEITLTFLGLPVFFWTWYRVQVKYENWYEKNVKNRKAKKHK